MIGVFDSGVGGLTVLKKLASDFTDQDFLYVGDTARLPYGGKSPEMIRRYTEEIMQYLLEQKADAIVIACNSASSVYREKFFKNIPVFNVIEPGAQMAVKLRKSNTIAVLGTQATINSQAYQNEIHKIDKNIEVIAQACPLFVPLAEEAWIDDPVTNLIAYRYIHPLLQHDMGALILGCTHYPLLKSSIQKVVGPQVPLVESGNAISELINIYFRENSLEMIANRKRKISVAFTDYSAKSALWAQEIMSPYQIDEIIEITV